MFVGRFAGFSGLSAMALGMVIGLFNTAVALSDEVPSCAAYALKSQNGGDPGSLEVNNEQVLQWKTSTDNQYHDRGHVQGKIVRVYPDKNGHEHFAIQIG